ncbi:MAG: RES domain-containing protein [Bacteroidales bacterium]|nr:RES domain-containing protein [Bacteroidales bacterium]
MIDKITKNKDNLGEPDLNPIEDIKEKLDYYRGFLGKIQDLSEDEFQSLKSDISIFFTFKVGSDTKNPPKRLIRISNNNRILASLNKELSYLTEISQLLAPPIDYCNFGRCNIPQQQVLYCATSEAGAYWETRPQSGDVITISHWELKPETNVNCFIVTKEKTKNPKISNEIQEVYYLLEDFFADVFSQFIDRDRPRDYLFSSMLSSGLIFYPVVADNNFEAVIYPSVQKKKFGINFAIRNELILEKYNLIGVETRFILDEYNDLDPSTEEVTTDQLIGSFGTETFDFEKGTILYDKKADEIFKLFRDLQINGSKQVRFEHPDTPKNLMYNLSLKIKNENNTTINDKKFGRNDKVNVVYQNGTRLDHVKYKKVLGDIESGKCKIVKY